MKFCITAAASDVAALEKVSTESQMIHSNDESAPTLVRHQRRLLELVLLLPGYLPQSHQVRLRQILLDYG